MNDVTISVERALYKSSYKLAWSMSAALIVMYGFVPFIVDALGGRTIGWAEYNFQYSIIFLCIHLLVLLTPSVPAVHLKGIMPERQVSPIGIFLIFSTLVALFYNFPWHDDRTSLGSTFSAIGRVSWLYVCYSVLRSNEKVRFLVLAGTLILMFVDQSRTIFILCLLILGAASRYKIIILSVGLALVILLAAVRMESANGFLFSIYYGVFGEAYNAAYSFSQVSQVEIVGADRISHVVGSFFQFFLLPVAKIFGTILDLPNLFFPQRILNEAVDLAVREKLAPMGGWYLAAEFSYMGFLGGVFLAVYYFLAIYITKIVFFSRYIPVYMFFCFLIIKSTPAVYFNLIIYIAVIFFLINTVRKLRWGHG
ncbi:hypothetical protein OAS81_04495 [Gammaproteobacteria bacterium]|nr:hypothetical protein [Gammaproteobacteria bacterium]